MMRFMPCYQVVESMRNGMSPQAAVEDALARIAVKFPTYQGAMVAVSMNGTTGGAGYGWTFIYSIASPTTGPSFFFTTTEERNED